MRAHKCPPKLAYGGSGCKIQYKIFDFHAISLNEMIIGAKTLIFSQELDCFRTQAPGARWVVQKLFHHLYYSQINVIIMCVI